MTVDSRSGELPLLDFGSLPTGVVFAEPLSLPGVSQEVMDHQLAVLTGELEALAYYSIVSAPEESQASRVGGSVLSTILSEKKNTTEIAAELDCPRDEVEGVLRVLHEHDLVTALPGNFETARPAWQFSQNRTE